MDQPLKIQNSQRSSHNAFPSSNSTVSAPDSQKSPFLRRTSISDTHLPRLDIPHFVQPQETNQFTRVLSGLIESSSNLSLNKIHTDFDHQQHNRQSNLDPPQLSSSLDRNKSAFELASFNQQKNNPITPIKADPTLRKSSSVANYALSGHLSPPSHHQHSHSSALLGSTHQIPTIPEQDSDQGLTMNMSARPVTTSGIAAANAALGSSLGSTQSDRKATGGFGGLVNKMSGLFNKPITHLGDREENYRYIMALDR